MIYVYADKGVAEESLEHTLLMLKKNLSQFSINTIKANQIKTGNWADGAVLFVMPGGSDLPYVRKLAGVANQNIQNFVKSGGAYLGICAGAYYGSSFVEFDKNGDLEVIGQRELALFPGKAVGPLLAPYSYINKSGARSALIKLDNFSDVNLFFNGGCFFENAKDYANSSVIANYQLDDKSQLPAIISVKYGAGNVVLSGVHFEYDANLLDQKDIYLAEIIQKLLKTNSERELLIKLILKQLNLAKNSKLNYAEKLN